MIQNYDPDSGSDILIQIGDAGGIETSGYVAGAGSAGWTNISKTTGFVLKQKQSDDNINGMYHLTLLNASTFTWVGSGSATVNGSDCTSGGGGKSLSAELTQVKVMGHSGDAPDSGTIAYL